MNAAERANKIKTAHGEEKDWFMLLIDTKRKLEHRIFKLERRVKELEETERSPPLQLGKIGGSR